VHEAPGIEHVAGCLTLSPVSQMGNGKGFTGTTFLPDFA
jgi:hypothetical protein